MWWRWQEHECWCLMGQLCACVWCEGERERENRSWIKTQASTEQLPDQTLSHIMWVSTKYCGQRKRSTSRDLIVKDAAKVVLVWKHLVLTRQVCTTLKNRVQSEHKKKKKTRRKNYFRSKDFKSARSTRSSRNSIQQHHPAPTLSASEFHDDRQRTTECDPYYIPRHTTQRPYSHCPRGKRTAVCSAPPPPARGDAFSLRASIHRHDSQRENNLQTRYKGSIAAVLILLIASFLCIVCVICTLFVIFLTGNWVIGAALWTEH